jgi:hypothetical protein
LRLRAAPETALGRHESDVAVMTPDGSLPILADAKMNSFSSFCLSEVHVGL